MVACLVILVCCHYSVTAPCHVAVDCDSNLMDVMQVEGSAGSEEEGKVRDSPRRILAAAQTKQSPAVSWSARQRSRRASASPQSNRQVYPACQPC